GRLVRPGDPAEHRHLALDRLGGAIEVGALAVRDVFAPGLDHAQRAALGEHLPALLRHVDVRGPVCRRHRQHEALVPASAGRLTWLEHGREAAVNHAAAVEGHFAHLLHCLVRLHLLPRGIAGRAVGPGDPRKHDALVVLRLHCVMEVRALAPGSVYDPGLDHAGGAVLPEYGPRCRGVVDVVLLAGSRDGCDQTGVVHGHLRGAQGRAAPALWRFEHTPGGITM